jgi:hypothetical protein
LGSLCTGVFCTASLVPGQKVVMATSNRVRTASITFSTTGGAQLNSAGAGDSRLQVGLYSLKELGDTPSLWHQTEMRVPVHSITRRRERWRGCPHPRSRCSRDLSLDKERCGIAEASAQLRRRFIASVQPRRRFIASVQPRWRFIVSGRDFIRLRKLCEGRREDDESLLLEPRTSARTKGLRELVL